MPIGHCPIVVPGGKDRVDAHAQLVPGPVRKGPPSDLLHPPLHRCDEALQHWCTQFAVRAHPSTLLGGLEELLKGLVWYAHHDIAKHGNEATVGIVSKARVIRRLDEALYGVIVEANVEHSIHHPWHRFTCS